jgi:hypothetical protein
MKGEKRLNIWTNPKAWIYFPVCLLVPSTAYMQAIVRAENPFVASVFFVVFVATLMLVRALVKETCRVPPAIVALLVGGVVTILTETHLLGVPGVGQKWLRSFFFSANIVLLMQEILQVPIVLPRPKPEESLA